MADKHEPPFDGKPCPMCPMAIRNLSAVVHNFLHDGNEMDLVELAVAECAPLITPDTAQPLRDLHEAASHYLKWFGRAAHGPNEEAREFARTNMWSWHTKMREATAAVAPLSEAHFTDPMHSHGQVRRFSLEAPTA